MRYLSLFSGIEAATVAWKSLGWECVGVAEVDPFANAALATHYPDVPNLGDVVALRDRLIAGENVAGLLSRPPDVIVGGSPCFTAGHLVLTDRGYRPIEELREGDVVVTHHGRCRPITAVGSKIASVGLLSGVGLRRSLTVTPDHPFLSVSWRRQNTRRGNRYARIEHCGEPEWVSAEKMPGRQWTSLTEFHVPAPDFPSGRFNVQQILYMAGMYLGDGHIRRYTGKTKKAITFSLNPKKLEKLQSIIGTPWASLEHARTSVRPTLCYTEFAKWLLKHFGEYSHLKTLPAWVLSHPERAHLLQGYLDTDGHDCGGGQYSASTTSICLAYGLADLFVSCGYNTGVGFIKTPDTTTIEGRTVFQRDYFQIRAWPIGASRQSRVRHGYLLRKTSTYQPCAIEQQVFNIEVEEDHSYVVQGAVVHNCQAWSVAGSRKGLSDPRGQLTLIYAEIVNAIRPEFIVWENVPGVLSAKDNGFGHLLGALSGHGEPLAGCSPIPVPPGHKRWSNAGVVAGPTRALAWRILDAQHFGVPQRRRRVFLIGCSSASGRDPSEILLERQSLCGNPPARGKARKDIAGTLAARTHGGGFPGTDEACSGYLQGGVEEAFSFALRGRDGGALPEIHKDGQSVGSLRASGGGSSRDYIAYGGNNTSGPIKLATAVNACASASGRMDFESETFIVGPVAFAENSRSEVRLEGGDGRRTGCLSTGGGKPGQGRPMIAFDCKAGGNTSFSIGDKPGTMRGEGHGGGHLAIAFDAKSSTPAPCRVQPVGSICGTVCTRHGLHPARFAPGTGCAHADARRRVAPCKGCTLQGSHANSGWHLGVAHTLRAEGFDASEGCTLQRDGTGRGIPLVPVSTSAMPLAGVDTHWAVRRLTPIECARLQGFPDDYLDIAYRNKPAADGNKYRALGNSMAVPVMRWIGERINL